METKKVIVDGKEIELVTKLDEADIEYNLKDDLDDTLDLSEILDKTMEVDLGDNNG